MEHPKQDQDTDLMPKLTEVTPQASQTPTTEKVPSEQGDTILLEDNPRTDVYNIAFDESQHRVVQARRVHTPDEHASPTHVEEWVIVLDVRRHPTALIDATKSYSKTTSSSVKFLMKENERMVKELQATRQRDEQSTRSARA